jgi:hypothetical protein
MMRDSEIDRILAEEDTILPSSGFADSVMEAVRREAQAPAPIQFPWKRALPGLAAGALILSLIVIEVILYVTHGAPAEEISPASWPWLDRIVQSSAGTATAWVTFALVLSLLSIKLSMRFARASVRRSA